MHVHQQDDSNGMEGNVHKKDPKKYMPSVVGGVRPRHPIVLVPGMSGSILVHKDRPFKNILGRKVVDNRWLHVHPFRGLDQWKEDMAYDVKRNRATGKITGFARTDCGIVPFDMGGVNGICNVVSELAALPTSHQDILHSYFNHRYMGPLVSDLLARGAVVRETLFGIPYDFRLFLDPKERMITFSNMKTWIEHAFQTGREPVIVVTHSLGGLLFKWFLSTFVPRGWVEEHIHEWVCINAPFGGTPFAARAVLCGEYYVPMFSHRFVDEIQRCSGVIMCLPNGSRRWEGVPLVKLPTHILSVDSYPEWADRGHLSFEIWRDLVAPHLESIFAPMPHVSTTLITCGGVETLLHCQTRGERILPHEVNYDPQAGDGIVPQRGFGAELDLFAHARRVAWAPGIGHVEVLDDPMLAGMIWKMANPF